MCEGEEFSEINAYKKVLKQNSYNNQKCDENKTTTFSWIQTVCFIKTSFASIRRKNTVLAMAQT